MARLPVVALHTACFGPQHPHVSNISKQACVLIFSLPPQPVLGSQMYWLVWVALAGVGIGAGMTFVPSLPALLHATRTLVRISRPPQANSYLSLMQGVCTAPPAFGRDHAQAC